MRQICLNIFIFCVCVAGFTTTAALSSAQNGADSVSTDATLDERWKRDIKPEIVESLSPSRGRISLDGVWKFFPYIAKGNLSPEKGAGYIHVPGSWAGADRGLDNSILPGENGAWNRFRGDDVSAAWYEREISVPAAWDGNAILLSFDRVCTEAIVTLDGKEAGRVSWPSGEIDVTKFVHPGKTSLLRILVAATGDQNEATEFLKTRNPGSLKTSSSLKSRGVTGGITLLSRPRANFLDGVFVRTSVRKKEISLDMDIRDVSSPQSAELNLVFQDEKGVEEKRISSRIELRAAETQKISVTFPWDNPRIWDIDHPFLYTLQLTLKTSQSSDALSQNFGFREFWIEGKRFILNGTEIRFRPDTYDPSRSIESLRADGFNFTEIWPDDPFERGTANRDEEWFEKSDRAGWLTSGRLASQTLFIYAPGYRFIWNDAEKQAWSERLKSDLRKYRNHPSVVMWGHTPNLFGDGQDQNPRILGRKDISKRSAPKDAYRAGQEGCDAVRVLDPTRPVFTHEGGDVGDVFMVNTYLNLLPLQEREEWLSAWSKSGDMPYMAIEFGTPLFTTFLRGRSGFGNAVVSEPFLTEYSAIYLGADAYRNETSEYRANYVQRFEKGQKYRFDWGKDRPPLIYSPNFQQIQTLFDTQTWRSWRTQGITGGMVPWDRHGWQDGKKTISGEALVANNSPTLAWISGSAEAFTAKTHHYKVDDTVDKQVVLINDTRVSQPYKYYWKAFVDGRAIANGQGNGQIKPAQTIFRPIRFSTPFFSKPRAEGQIVLTAKIGDVTHEDRFSFGVFARRKRGEGSLPTLPVFDPGSKTADLLFSLDLAPRNWKGEKNAPIVIIGRQALSSGKPLPGDLEAYVRGGGRVLVFGQTPDWIEKTLGFRVSPQLARRAFPVDKDHPALRGLDASDFRDWRGNSTLLPATPSYSGDTPPHAWRWGNRGVVSSVPIEKPHFGSWRPILECEFDLAYSPLVEMDYGKGRVILCTLDLEDHAQYDPAADKIWQKLIDYALHAPLNPKSIQTLYFGGDVGATLLDKMGVLYVRTGKSGFDTEFARGGATGKIALVGEGAHVETAALEAFLMAGGKAFFLPAKQGEERLSGALLNSSRSLGSLNPPAWPECRGLSLSDLRFRGEATVPLLQSLPVLHGKDAQGKPFDSKNLIGAEGLLGRVQLGKGVALFCQCDPDRFDADTKTYFRLTRWRQSHALNLLLSNCGVSFKQDASFFRFASPSAATQKPGEANWYHPDYRSDFELGDDPYRYFRW